MPLKHVEAETTDAHTRSSACTDGTFETGIGMLRFLPYAYLFPFFFAPSLIRTLDSSSPLHCMRQVLLTLT